MVNNQYIDYVNNETKPKNYFFNKKKRKIFEPYYGNCATYEYSGDGNENNYSSCEINYILKLDFINSTNCVVKCDFYYYYTDYEQYKCTSR